MGRWGGEAHWRADMDRGRGWNGIDDEHGVRAGSSELDRHEETNCIVQTAPLLSWFFVS